MRLLTLNADVLDLILSRIEGHNLAKFLVTCRTAYNTALPHLLSSVDLRRSIKQVRDFCHFMLSETRRTRTLPMLRSLRMLGGACITNALEETTQASLGLDLLASLLEQTYNLKTLQISNIVLLLEHEPRIYDAIVHLPSIANIVLGGADEQSLDMISRMRDLRHIHITHESDCISAIRPFQPTLETLSSEYRFFQNRNDLLSLKDTDQWPRVHTLNLGVVNVEPQYLVHAFPNLRNLRLQAGVPSRSYPDTQERISECWPSLDYVEGNIIGLYQMALTCHIRELRITSAPEIHRWHGSKSYYRPPEMFLDLIRTSSPSALSFPFPAQMQDETWFRQLAASLSRLTVLGLSFVYDSTNTRNQLIHITKSLQDVPLLYLVLELSRSEPTKYSPREILTNLTPALLLSEVRVIELRLRGDIRVIELQLRGSPRDPAFGARLQGRCSWWKVTKGGQNAIEFEEISGELGLHLRENYITK